MGEVNLWYIQGEQPMTRTLTHPAPPPVFQWSMN